MKIPSAQIAALLILIHQVVVAPVVTGKELFVEQTATHIMMLETVQV